MAGRQTFTAIYKSAVGRAEVLDKIFTIPQGDARVTSRYLRFRIISIKINVGEHSAVSIPPADLRLVFAQQELLPGRPAAFNNQTGMRLRRRLRSLGKPD